MDDATLLRRYINDRAEDAFAEIVRRHVDLVYHAALRQTGGRAALAEEVTQSVFTDLARKAATLVDRPVLTGWLHTSTRFAAANARRSEARRRTREQEAHAMQETDRTESSSAADWARLRPAIDDALHALTDADRDAVLLRFFENRGFAEIGVALGLTPETARKRIERALDKLAAALSRHGITSTSSALSLALSHQLGAAAPAGLAANVTGIALASAAAAGGKSGAIAAGGVLAMLGAWKTVAVLSSVGVATAGLGFGWSQARELGGNRQQLARLADEEAALQATLHRLQQSFATVQQRTRAADADAEQLLRAIQDLALTQTLPAGDDAGIAFVVDTSGSMREPASGKVWPGVTRIIRDVLVGNPAAKFISLYDGDGRPLLGRRGWLRVNEEALALIERTVADYPQDTVSDPVPGIRNAMREIPPPGKTGPRLHLCVIGDEYNSTDHEENARRRLNELNPADASGRRHATISAVQLPTTTRVRGGAMGNTGRRFQTLMHDIAREHGGTYQLLSDDVFK